MLEGYLKCQIAFVQDNRKKFWMKDKQNGWTQVVLLVEELLCSNIPKKYYADKSSSDWKNKEFACKHKTFHNIARKVL